MSAPKAPPPGAAALGRLGMVSLRYDLARARNFARRLGVPPDSCDLGYLTHLLLTETFGNVTLEAMACGLPVVAAAATGQAAGSAACNWLAATSRARWASSSWAGL